MAVTAIRHVWSGANGRRSWNADVAGISIVRREYTRVFQVGTNDTRDGPAVVLNARLGTVAVPQIGDPYVVTATERDLAALCIAVDPRRREPSGYEWEVHCSFSSELPGNEIPPGGEVPPWELPPTEVEWGTEHRRVFWREDLDNHPFLNSAQEHMGPQEIDFPLTTYRCVRAEAPGARTHKEILSYRNTSNTKTWHLYDPYMAKMESIHIGYKTWEGQVYPVVTYQVIASDLPDGQGDAYFAWLKLLDEGHVELDASTNTQKTIRDRRDGSHWGKKVLLDGEGKKLATDAEPVPLKFTAWRDRDWDDLNLPQTSG